MNEGPVCAYVDRDAEPVTFPSAEAALNANYTIAHCGACGACSTWQNLEVEWSTRKQLASLSQNCAKKTLFEGFDSALQCHVDTIGFDEKCSLCWVKDEICARDHCLFIFLQASVINQLGNFAVSLDEMTSAMCEEAWCEDRNANFVPCSGASRRRMNIKSDIARPADEQCKHVPGGDAFWMKLFGDEHHAMQSTD